MAFARSPLHSVVVGLSPKADTKLVHTVRIPFGWTRRCAHLVLGGLLPLLCSYRCVTSRADDIIQKRGEFGTLNATAPLNQG